jgi:hypothetical protein
LNDGEKPASITDTRRRKSSITSSTRMPHPPANRNGENHRPKPPSPHLEKLLEPVNGRSLHTGLALQASPGTDIGATMSQTPVTTPQPGTPQNDPKRFTWSVSSQQRRSQPLPVPAGSGGK